MSVLYARYADNAAHDATITVSFGTATTGYPPANLANDDPAFPAKLDDTTGAYLFDFGAAQRVDGIALVHHNFAAGANVRLQGNATDVWTAPTVNELIDIPAYRLDKYPTNAVLDLSGLVSGTPASGYATSGLRYWRLLVVDDNTVAISIGEVVLVSQWRALEQVQTGVLQRPRRPVIDNRTDYGVSTIYDLGVTIYSFECDVLHVDSQGAAIDALWEDAHGKALPWLVWLNPLVNDVYLVRFTDDVQETVWKHRNPARSIRTQRLKLTEVGRGLIPTPSQV